MASQRRSFTAPLWLGRESLEGKTILLHAEQGFGDTIQFVRYARQVAERGAKTIIVEVPRELARLLLQMTGIDVVVARGAALPPFDCHCPLLSLPLAFATEPATIPADIPYLAARDDDVRLWRERLPQRRPLIGLAWSGARAHDNDLNRSLRLETFSPLFNLPDVTFVSLQHPVREEDEVFLRSRADVSQIGGEFHDFADTAAVLACLDAVISADTAVAHLAGAMGKPLLLLLPFAADFRWLRERQDSPWYPTARLFRQPRLAIGLVSSRRCGRNCSSTMAERSFCLRRKSCRRQWHYGAAGITCVPTTTTTMQRARPMSASATKRCGLRRGAAGGRVVSGPA